MLFCFCCSVLCFRHSDLCEGVAAVLLQNEVHTNKNKVTTQSMWSYLQRLLAEMLQ